MYGCLWHLGLRVGARLKSLVFVLTLQMFESVGCLRKMQVADFKFF